MGSIKRFAIYYAPRPGPFAGRVAAWLGWDADEGRELPHPSFRGLPRLVRELTAEPRKYGFHGTLRAPFRPAAGVGPERLASEVECLAARLAPVRLEGLRIADFEGCLALTPRGDEAAVMAFGAEVVRATDHLRAALGEAEIARRRPERLSVRQRALLERWGYPYVMEEFRFHLTLTGYLSPDETRTVAACLERHLAPVLPEPLEIADLCLCGEGDDGRFRILNRYPLSG